MSDQPVTTAEQVRRLYEDAEAQAASAAEELVSSNSFGELLAMTTGNIVAFSKMAADGMDQLLANLRVAGRADIAALGRQVARTEDKLEQLLQAIRALEDSVRALEERLPPPAEESGQGAGGRSGTQAARSAAARRAAVAAAGGTRDQSSARTGSDQ